MRSSFIFTRINFAIQTNAVLYFLSRPRILGAINFTGLYKSKIIKLFFSAFGFAFGMVKDALFLNLYTVAAIYYLPLVLLGQLGTSGTANAAVYAILFATICCLFPALRQSSLLKPTRDDVMFLNHFMIEPARWYRQKLIRNLWREGILIIPALFFVFRDINYVFTLLFMKLAALCLGDLLYLWLFRRNVKVPRSRIRLCISVLAGLLMYAGSLFMSLPDIPIFILMTIDCLFLPLCVLAVWRLLKYDDYKAVAVKFASLNSPALLVQTLQDSEMDEMNLAMREPEEHARQFSKYNKLPAFEFFERMLKIRMKRAFRSQRIQTLVLTAAMAVAAGLVFRNGFFGLETENLLDYSPFLISTVMGMAFGRSYLELCFRNMDLPLLHNGFYDETTIRKSILRRFGYLMANNAIFTLAAVADVLILIYIAQTRIPAPTFIALILIIVMILFIIDSLHLAAYYLLQPYTADSTIKSPIFTAVSTAESLLAYGILFFRGDISNSMRPLAALCILMACVLLLCLRRAPRTFVVRR